MHRKRLAFTILLFCFFSSSCGTSSTTEQIQTVSTALSPAEANETPKPLQPLSKLTINLDQETTSQYIALDFGGDVDSAAVADGRKTGNGQALPSIDGNSTPDSYMQFNVVDSAIFEGKPTSSVRIDIQYLDEGVDTFVIQYDAASGGPFNDGRFKESRPVVKTDSGEYLTATFISKDIRFSNRDNGADLRIDDRTDGAETIRRVTITILPQPTIINVDDCGANPWDNQPDSTAIQECINKTKTGDTILFTSGENSAGYAGYWIDKTIFLNEKSPRSYLTFSSTDPSNKALLKATADLKGYVMKLFARSRIGDPGGIDGMIITDLHLDGNRSERKCMGTDDTSNGLDDNWGSWLPECTEVWDSWCNPGTLDLAGGADWNDPSQDYLSHPELWSSGHLIENMTITNTECGTAFGMGGANNVILNNIIDTAGDHVHAAGCADTDETYEYGDWSDGITFDGPGHLVMGNTVINPSDIGIVFFGGRSTVIRENTIMVTAGNYGAFGGIAIHPWGLGDISFGQVTGNTVIGEGDETCGNLHTGINIGTHMWGGACQYNQVTPTIGNSSCSLDPSPPGGAMCPRSGACQLWASIAQADATYLFTDNQVSGAHINYLIEGLDLVGTLIESGNTSTSPRKSDWEAAHQSCQGVYWGPLDKVAHHPSLPGWTDKRIHCER
jgi:hypothetical protein